MKSPKLHHRHLAHEASVKIDAEIQANVHALDAALNHNNDQQKKYSWRVRSCWPASKTRSTVRS